MSDFKQLPFSTKNLRHLRKNVLGWTQQQMADKLGIKRSLLGAYEEGRADPKMSVLHTASQIFNISIDDLIEEDLTQEKVGELSNAFKMEVTKPTKPPANPAPGPALNQKVSPTKKSDSQPVAPENYPICISGEALEQYVQCRTDSNWLQQQAPLVVPKFDHPYHHRGFSLDNKIYLCQRLDNIFRIGLGESHVIVTEKFLEFGSISSFKPESNQLQLEAHQARRKSIPLDQVIECWKVEAIIFYGNDAKISPMASQEINRLDQSIKELQKAMQELRIRTA